MINAIVSDNGIVLAELPRGAYEVRGKLALVITGERTQLNLDDLDHVVRVETRQAFSHCVHIDTGRITTNQEYHDLVAAAAAAGYFDSEGNLAFKTVADKFNYMLVKDSYRAIYQEESYRTPVKFAVMTVTATHPYIKPNAFLGDNRPLNLLHSYTAALHASELLVKLFKDAGFTVLQGHNVSAELGPDAPVNTLFIPRYMQFAKVRLATGDVYLTSILPEVSDYIDDKKQASFIRNGLFDELKADHDLIDAKIKSAFKLFMARLEPLAGLGPTIGELTRLVDKATNQWRSITPTKASYVSYRRLHETLTSIKLALQNAVSADEQQ